MHELTARRDILVVGASAGGVMALRRFLCVLPENLRAAVFVVLHLPDAPVSKLDEILARSSPLEARFARDGEPIEHGRVYIAPPGQHLLLEENAMRLSRGAKENSQRPAIDALFRSAAVAFGARAIGLVLTGWLDDGAAGLVAIKRCGGIALVQQPEDAPAAEMPRRAIAALGGAVDAVLPIEGLARHVVGLIEEAARAPAATVPADVAIENALVDAAECSPEQLEKIGTIVPVTCPECGGPLWRMAHDVERYRCYQGHAFTALGLTSAQAVSAEQAMWSAVRLLEERANTLRHLEVTSRQKSLDAAAEGFAEESRETRQHARTLRNLLLGRESTAGEPHRDA
jgi:two-component system, chemotaxis family, protein-glutamate methylesterase/glutaminase